MKRIACSCSCGAFLSDEKMFPLCSWLAVRLNQETGPFGSKLCPLVLYPVDMRNKSCGSGKHLACQAPVWQMLFLTWWMIWTVFKSTASEKIQFAFGSAPSRFVSSLLSAFCYIPAEHRDSVETSQPASQPTETVCVFMQVSWRSTNSTWRLCTVVWPTKTQRV